MSNLITSEDFAKSLEGFALDSAYKKIAIAVSGGGDSMALALLFQEWVQKNGGELLAFTVDHKLRPESGDEALGVQKILNAKGISHEILTWDNEKPCTHIQELAREARYNLMLNECKKRGFHVLAVAHNLEDQVETFWMRLSHGSGLDGLSSMAAIRDVDSIKIIRPVMEFTREQLRATCERFNVEWVEDPSNQNKKYLRVKLREFEKLLAEEGMTPARITKSIQKLEDARQALQYMTDKSIEESVEIYPEGHVKLKLNSWKEYPHDIQRRVLTESLQLVYPKTYKTGYDAIEQTRLDLLGDSFAGKTLSGCEIFPEKSGDVWISREFNTIECNIAVKSGDVWDKRFLLAGFADDTLELGVLGDKGLSELRKNEDIAKNLEHLPFKIKRILPAVWRDGELLAVPHIEYYSLSCSKELEKIKIIFVN